MITAAPCPSPTLFLSYSPAISTTHSHSHCASRHLCTVGCHHLSPGKWLTAHMWIREVKLIPLPCDKDSLPGWHVLWCSFVSCLLVDGSEWRRQHMPGQWRVIYPLHLGFSSCQRFDLFHPWPLDTVLWKSVCKPLGSYKQWALLRLKLQIKALLERSTRWCFVGCRPNSSRVSHTQLGRLGRLSQTW
jgi:hypothetical protein